MGTYLIRTLLWMGVLASLCSALPAQDSGKTAAITIEVQDQSGGVIPNAQVQITPSPNRIGKNPITDVDGRLHLDMPPGIYDLSVTSRGFTRVKKQVEVQDATPQLVSVVLAPGSCPPGPCLVVTEALPLLSPEQVPAVSPDGRYAIVEIASDWEPRHTVFLEDRVLKTQRKLFSYDQPESFLWNYDSKVFAVTDYANYIGNDSSVRSIFSVDENVPPVPVLDLLFRQLSESARENLKARLSNHHVNFVEALAWIKPMDLELKVSGYGDKDHASFAETYKLHVDLGHQ